jgi:hypothetical protein
MPNWCNNYLKLEGPQGLVDRAKEAIKNDRLCDEFFSIPGELRDTRSPTRPEDADKAAALVEKYGYADWYSFCVGEWGTKWDISGGVIQEEGDGYIIASFDTAWSPPIALIEKLEGHGFTSVVIDYFEPGMNFVGQWNNGYDECYEIDEDVPEEMDDLWGISEMLAEREEFEDEEEE